MPAEGPITLVDIQAKLAPIIYVMSYFARALLSYLFSRGIGLQPKNEALRDSIRCKEDPHPINIYST
jgi:hypothetical protein